MLNSTVLEIGIGLAVTYLGLSLVVTAFNELIAAIFRSRARDLVRGIGNMLDGSSAYPPRWWQKIRICSKMPTQGTWAQAFFQHQLVNAMSQDEESPSYVPSHAFATVLMHLVYRASRHPENSPTRPAKDFPDPMIDGQCMFDHIEQVVEGSQNTRLREVLLPIIQTARSDFTNGVAALTKVENLIEIWFDHCMDRVTGWYKRRTQWFLFLFALISACALNVDTVAITRRLSSSQTLRDTVVESAKQYTTSLAHKRTTAPSPAQFNDAMTQLQNNVNQLKGLGMPIGWNYHPEPKHSVAGTAPDDANLWRLLHRAGWLEFWTKVAGLFVTAFAASLGAPFWFDTLNKFMSIRATGKPPEEIPKEPKAVLQPQSP